MSTALVTDDIERRRGGSNYPAITDPLIEKREGVGGGWNRGREGNRSVEWLLCNAIPDRGSRVLNNHPSSRSDSNLLSRHPARFGIE